VPYYITDTAEGCDGWATIKDDGEIIGCHETKQAAIDQMVAVSLAEGMEPGGERQVDLTVPAHIRSAAARGLELRREGEGGDGLVERTIREARLMADGQVSEDKVIRASAWAARHLVDLEETQNSDPDDDGWPGAGAVAFYLWGIDPLNPQPATSWFDRKAEQIRAEEARDAHPDTMFHMENGIETRRICINDFEIRNGETGDGMTFSGYAAVFNSDSEPLPFTERILPGAFQRSLGSRNEIKMFVNHDTSRVLASKRAGTLRLSEDQHGLRVDADLPDTSDGRDMAVLLQRGDIDSMSFGFSVPKGGDSWSDDGQQRELREIRLHEVSIVTGFPAYTATTAAVRSLDALSERTGLDPDSLNTSITKLVEGEELTTEEASLIDEAVKKLRSDVEDAAASLARKRKELDLLLHKV
jgi:HK97 family phage prohead protease